MSSAEIRFIVNRSDVDEQLDDIEEEAKIALDSIATNIRRTAEIGIFFAQASGIAIDQVLQLYIESGLRAIEFTVAFQSALAVGTLGTSQIIQLGFQAGAVALMFVQISALRNQKAELAQKIGFATSGLRALTF